MIINVGSKNPVKIEAVREALLEYYPEFKLNFFEVNSGVSEQPIGIDEIGKGAEDRARNSFISCDYSIGYESGLISYSNKFVDFGICVIYNGQEFYHGFSQGFMVPSRLVELIREENLDLSQAAKRAGLTNSKKIGEEGGIINLLSKGRFVHLL